MKGLKLSAVAMVALLLVAEGVYLGSHELGWISRETLLRNYHLMASVHNISQRFTWLGIPTFQNPDDVWIIQEIIFDVKPDLIIETGTFMGGSAAIWAMLQREVAPDGRIVTIDIESKARREDLPQSLRARIDFLIGSSVAPEIITKVLGMARGKRALVLLDSDHHADYVLKELIAYAPMVSPGSYMIVHDTEINHPVIASYQLGDPGPMAAVERFLSSHREFYPDTSREKFLVTNSPKGYLKRIV